MTRQPREYERRPTSAPLSLRPTAELMWRYVCGDPIARNALDSWRTDIPVSEYPANELIWSHEVTL